MSCEYCTRGTRLIDTWQGESGVEVFINSLGQLVVYTHLHGEEIEPSGCAIEYCPVCKEPLREQ